MLPTAEQLELARRASGLSLDAEGELRHDGDPIVHRGLRQLFQSGLDVLPSGEAIVRVGDQWAYVQCAGSPFVVQRLRSGEHGIALQLNTGAEVQLPAEQVQLQLRGDHTLTVALPQPGREARLGRRAWHAVAQGLDVGADGRLWLEVGPHRLAVHRPQGLD